MQFPQPRVNAPGIEHVLLDDAIGNWWSVIVWCNDPTDLLLQNSLDKLAALGARLVAIVWCRCS